MREDGYVEGQIEPELLGESQEQEHTVDDEFQAGDTNIQDISGKSLYQLDGSHVVPETIESLASLRASGASREDIVRGARQIYGDGLPQNALKPQELKLYKRLYGDPISSSYEEFLDGAEALEVDDSTSHQLFDQEGERIDYEPSPDDLAQLQTEKEHDTSKTTPQPAAGGIGINSMAPQAFASPAERAQEIARMLNGQVLEEGELEEEGEEDEIDEELDPTLKTHPFTKLGKFATTPKSIFLSHENFVEPIQNIMSEYSNKHLKEMCEKTFGGPGLPDSPLTPRSGRSRPQVPIPLDASQQTMGEMEANAFVTTIMPPTYAAIMAVLVETRKRLGTTWLNNLLAKEGGPRVLDVGAGGAGIIAWREIVQAHWDSLHTSDKDPVPRPPPTKSVVLTGSDTLRHRAASLLENTTFIPRLPDYVHARDTPTLEDDRPAQQRKQFDVIIAPHSIFPLQEDYMRRQHVQNLWSMLAPDGGVLILIEKGIPRGFEAIAGARDMLLKRNIAIPEGRTTDYSDVHQDPDDIHTRETGMIVAPCTNHEKCPMYKIPGVSKGRKDFCSFQQRYIRPSYLQRVLGARDRNHDDVDFSYLSVMKGQDLRQRQVQSWSGLADSLSAPVHPNPQLAADDYSSWTDLAPEGFEEVHPESSLSDVPALFTNAGKAPSTLPSAQTLPRLVFMPMKRRGHVILDVCTSRGNIERWTVPRSFGHQAYRDARKSRWGDLWALGAKTRINRNLRLGGENTKEATKARGRKERLKEQADELRVKMEEEKLEEMLEMQEIEKEMREGRFMDERQNRDLEEKVKKMTTGAPKPGKIKREISGTGLESFTMDDFDMDVLNPPLFPKKPSTSKSKSPSGTAGQRQRKSTFSTSEADEETDLTREELAVLREWAAELEPEETKAAPVKGPRTIRTYSKFAPGGRKKVVRKSGKVR